MNTGTIKLFDSGKGFGFIVPADGNDLFVHHSEIKTKGYALLHESQKFEIELGHGKKTVCDQCNPHLI